jgi:hypothetical protein
VDQIEREKRKYLTSYEAFSIPFPKIMDILQQRIEQGLVIQFQTYYETTRCTQKKYAIDTEQYVKPELANRFARIHDEKFVSFYETSVIPDGQLYLLIKHRKQHACQAFLMKTRENNLNNLERTTTTTTFCQGHLHIADNMKTRRVCPNHPTTPACHHCFFCQTCFIGELI